MDVRQKAVMEKQIETVIRNLERNNMRGYYVPSRKDVPAQVEALLREGDTVTVGGSMSLNQSGVMDLLRSGRYRFLDRAAPGLTPEQVRQVYLDGFGADAFLSSTNAITLNGELYNVDGNANRVACLCYGPRSVILVVGCNKIVADLHAAQIRVKRVAAPENVARLSCETYCAHTGFCQGLEGEMTDGCRTPGRICCTYLVQGYQREAGRIKVILVGEELGY